MTAARRSDRQSRRYRLNVAVRAVAATLGAYGLTVLATMALARAWPADRLQATLAATMIAFALFPAIVLWAFLARTPLRACGGLIAAAVLAGGLAFALGPHS